MPREIRVEHVIDHEYKVLVDADGETAESAFVVDPQVLAGLGFAPADERRVVEHTAAFLAEHQPVIDFPQLVYLDEVAAAYDDYAERLRDTLG